MAELSRLDPASEGALEAQRRWIQERARHPRFAGQLEPADARGFARNPSCGDTVAVSLRFSRPPDQVQAIRCAVRGCVLCSVSADLMAELVSRQTPGVIAAMVSGVSALLRGQQPEPAVAARLAPMAILARLPARARCVLLPWQALLQALELEQGRDGESAASG